MSAWYLPRRCLSPCCKRSDSAPFGGCPATLLKPALRRGRDTEVRRWLIAVFLQIELLPPGKRRSGLTERLNPLATVPRGLGTRASFNRSTRRSVPSHTEASAWIAPTSNVQRFGRRKRPAAHLILANGFERFETISSAVAAEMSTVSKASSIPWDLFPTLTMKRI